MHLRAHSGRTCVSEPTIPRKYKRGLAELAEQMSHS
jgi:hypothetical protein